jgi:hypothetical protein
VKALGVLLGLVMAAGSVSAQAGPAADAIYYHGNILTGSGLEGADPERVSAIAVAHGEILAAGDDAAIIARYKSARGRRWWIWEERS